MHEIDFQEQQTKHNEHVLSVLGHIEHNIKVIMSAISDFATKLNTFFDKQDSDIDALTSEIALLNTEITALQNSAGAITPSDQALLDSIQTRVSGIVTKMDALSAATPPIPPAGNVVTTAPANPAPIGNPTGAS